MAFLSSFVLNRSVFFKEWATLGIYERLGLRPIINARGTHTRLGGTLILPEVLDAMREAAGAYIVLEELRARGADL